VGVYLHACILTYAACNALSYCHPRPLCLHYIFRHYLINDTIFGGGGGEDNKKWVFCFSLQLLFETFLILRRIERDIVINVKTFSFKVFVVLVGF
jgi:hypothetical protein